MRAVSGSGSSIMSDSWIDWKPRDRRAVEGEPVLEDALVERRSRDREVLNDTGQIAEPDVDVLDLLVLDQLDDVVGRLFCH